jgi:hypothetical protein
MPQKKPYKKGTVGDARFSNEKNSVVARGKGTGRSSAQTYSVTKREHRLSEDSEPARQSRLGRSGTRSGPKPKKLKDAIFPK